MYHKPVLAVTSKRGRSSRLGKNPSSRLGWKNHPLSEDTKSKLKFSLCIMLLVFSASKNVSFNDNSHILKFSTEGFENLQS